MNENDKLDAESYLKSGSNELRVLEYRTTGMSFGINILKVSKIISELVDFTTVPESHPAVKGVFRDMDRLVPVVDLAAFLGVSDESTKCKKVIVTEFFGVTTGFWVDQIDWIHRFKWEDVIDAKSVFSGIEHPYVLGIVKPTEDRMIQLLDYETMLLDLNPGLQAADNASEVSDVNFSGKSVLIVEDSPAVRLMLINEMSERGFKTLEASDGAQGWEVFEKTKVDLVICDVEMPVMDGLALTLKIRQSERSETPVIVYSSIGDVGMKARAAYLKADAHITKLDLPKLILTAQKLINGEKLDQDDVTKEPSTAVIGEMVPLD